MRLVTFFAANKTYSSCNVIKGILHIVSGNAEVLGSLCYVWPNIERDLWHNKTGVHTDVYSGRHPGRVAMSA